MKPETITIIDLMKRKAAERKNRRRLKRRQRQRDRGMWYCTHCDKIHGKRVVEYSICEDRCVDSVCSLGMQAWIDESKNNPAETPLKEKDFYKFIAGKHCGKGGE